MDVPGQGGDIVDILHVVFLIENGLVKVRHAPPLRNVEIEQFGQFIGRLLSNVVAPCSEWYQQVVFLIKWHVAVHHGTDADRSDLGQFNAVSVLHIPCHLCVTGMDTFPDVIH